MSKKWKEENPERVRESNRLYHLNKRKKFFTALRIEALSHYGGGKLQCAVCGETRLPALTIDHINGGGVRHRKALGLGGSKLYPWLKEQGYPDGYLTLCMNCQFVKREVNREYRGNANS